MTLSNVFEHFMFRNISMFRNILKTEVLFFFVQAKNPASTGRSAQEESTSRTQTTRETIPKMQWWFSSETLWRGVSTSGLLR